MLTTCIIRLLFYQTSAKIFLIEALKKQVTSNILSPEILSIEDFVHIAGIRTIDPIEFSLNFMKCTCQILKKVINNPLSYLSHWAKTLLQDFNEIDRYLLDLSHVLSLSE
jgi:hypothetical protein